MATKIQQLDSSYNEDVAKAVEKYQILRDLDIFVLDNSIRETTLGQVKGHTLDSKLAIFDEVRKCGFRHTIVAGFSNSTRADDDFTKQLIKRGEDPDGLWVFSEITEGITEKLPDTDSVPVSMRKMKEFGLHCVILEVDLGDGVYDFEKFTIEDMCALLDKWNEWCYENFSARAKVMFSLRDLPDTMPEHSSRVFEVVSFLASLPANRRPFGILFEETHGESLPEECGMWARYIRKVMDDNDWKGHLLVHVHEKFGLCDATALQVLMDGANGIWANICTEGAVIGNSSSCVTLMNLIRLGNKEVLKKFNCTYMRKAAINVTLIATGEEPHIKQPVFGARAIDLVFDLSPKEFDLASFFGEKPPVRITTLASKGMIQQRMVELFGDDPQFTLELAHRMKELILDDLRTGRKEEYMSEVGLVRLFDRAGGQLTANMTDAVDNYELKSPHAKKLISQVRKIWDEWDLKNEVQVDERLKFDSFYNGFMAPYFSCYRSNDTRKALQAIDMDSDGMVDWGEFELYLKWAINQYPNTEDVDSLLDITFRKGLIPAMQGEFLSTQ